MLHVMGPMLDMSNLFNNGFCQQITNNTRLNEHIEGLT